MTLRLDYAVWDLVQYRTSPSSPWLDAQVVTVKSASDRDGWATLLTLKPAIAPGQVSVDWTAVVADGRFDELIRHMPRERRALVLAGEHRTDAPAWTLPRAQA